MDRMALTAKGTAATSAISRASAITESLPPLTLKASSVPAKSGWVDTTPFIFAVYAAVGVGASMFMMAATNTEPPPAAGTALALVAHGFSWELVVFVATAVLIMVAIHHALKRHMTDLY